MFENKLTTNKKIRSAVITNFISHSCMLLNLKSPHDDIAIKYYEALAKFHIDFHQY